jgi:hypothetical protein
MQRNIIFATDSVGKQKHFSPFSLEHFSYSEFEGLPDLSFITALYVCLSGCYALVKHESSDHILQTWQIKISLICPHTRQGNFQTP